jgi:L-Ala-D/L-Glu epimerase
MRVVKHEFHRVRLPYEKPIKWAGSVEDGVDILLMSLFTGDGLKGVAEASVRLKWNSTTLKSLETVLEQVFLPTLYSVDIDEPAVVEAAFKRFREHPLAKSLLDIACWDLRAQARGLPFWSALGGISPAVPVSYTVTRRKPVDMARDAESARASGGFRFFKVKTGQGFEADDAALSSIRSAVGRDVTLLVDSNGAHSADEVPKVSEMMARFGVEYFEDPCALVPNSSYKSLEATSAIPFLIDDGCRSFRDGSLFIDAGATALSVKVMKTGLAESLMIGALAEKRGGVKVSVGISACSSFGAIAALSLAGALPEVVKRVPCEETFFFIAGGFLKDELAVENGSIMLPNEHSFDVLLDWRKIAARPA